MEQIVIVKTEVFPISLSIKTGTNTITKGYILRATLQKNGMQVAVDACNLCVTEMQSVDWCIRQCTNLADRLAGKSRYTPGEIMQILHCGYGPLAELGIPIPPQKRRATMVEMQEFHAKTGRGMVYIENDLYREWAVAYNQWIRKYSEKAANFGCTFQDENWIPVK